MQYTYQNQTNFSFLLVRDVPQRKQAYNTKNDLIQYIKDATIIFHENIDNFIKLETPTGLPQEHRLRVLLESLINAKRLWQEENEIPHI